MSELKALRAELGRVNELLADARARETQATLARFKEQVALLGISEKEVCAALGYDKKKKPLPPKYRDPATGNKWSGKGRMPGWLVGKRLDAYLVDGPQAQPWWPEEK